MKIKLLLLLSLIIMSSTINIGGVKWYHYLVVKEKRKSLFADHPRNSLSDKFLVCWDYKDDSDKKNSKIYAVFPNYVHFVKFFLSVPKELRSFYEIVLGENYQKIHFDLDLESDDKKLGEQILSDLIIAVVKVLSPHGIVLNLSEEVCVYSSHGTKKQSYHVVINNYCHTDHNEAKAFYYAVMAQVPKEYLEKKWIDSSVYSKTQQFRTYGSCKSGTNRFKCLVMNWRFGESVISHQREIEQDEKLQFLIDFELSSISASIKRCRILPSFTDTEEYRKMYSTTENIDNELAWEALQLLAHKAGVTPDHPKFPYKFHQVENNFILLKRTRASRCRVCNRIHEHENPYLIYIPESGDVYFDCRRAGPNKKLYLGSLKQESEEEDVEKVNIEPENNTVKSWHIQKIHELAGKTMNKKKKSVKSVDPQAKDLLMKNLRSQIQ